MSARGLLTDRRLLERIAVAGALLAVALVRCDVVMPAGAGSTGSAGGTATPAAAVTGVGPGVTDTSVTVDVVGVNLAKVEKSLGFHTPDFGNLAGQVAALQQYVNGHGGIAGRQLKATYIDYEASADSATAEQALCNRVTEDDHAFAVVLIGQFQNNARPCYAQHHTLMLDETLTPSSQALYRQLSPYLWSPDYPSADSFTSTFISYIAGVGFFKGATKVGFVATDSPVNRTIWSAMAVPLLKRYGVTGVPAFINQADLGTLNTGLIQAAINFRSQGITKVSFLGGSRLASFFLTAAATQSFQATYAISSFDNPLFLAQNPATIPATELPGTIGLGFDASQESVDQFNPWPSTTGEKSCVDIMRAGGHTFTKREDAQDALLYCDALLLLQAGAKNLGKNLNAAAWADGVRALGTSFHPASGFSTDFSGSRYAGAASYRGFVFRQSCTCFVYGGGDEPFVNAS